MAPEAVRILVCGGAGYIGSHMCKMLAEHGHELQVLDDLSTGHAEAARWGRFHRGSISDPILVGSILEDFGPDAVIHFAARSLVGESILDPAGYYHNNVVDSLTFLDQVRRRAGCAVIFSSTAAIFGIPETRLIGEEHRNNPINPYGRTKLAIEGVLSDYWQAYQLPSVSLRYFNAAGADSSGEIGEAHTCETHLIPRILEAVLGRSQPISVFGSDYETNDGTGVRDYVHVHDLCHAHLLGLTFLATNPGAHVFNLGNGEGFSVRQVLSCAEEIVGKPIEFNIGGRREGDPPYLVADSKKARRELNWVPTHDQLPTIIESAWKWHSTRTY